VNNSRKYPLAAVKVLYAKAAGRCSFADCRKDVVLKAFGNDKTKQIGKIGHIVAHSEGGPRTNPSYPIDTYENWILLCPTCHDTVDNQESKYTVDNLNKIKTEHEAWVDDQLDKKMSEVSFSELEIAAKALSSGKHSNSSDFQVIPPGKKIDKNGLTEKSRSYISMGLSRSGEVGRFIASMSQLDEDYPERLRAGFSQKYLELKANYSGDELFFAMLEFAQAGQRDFKQQAAGLAILSHLFHLCEVFEK